MLEALRLVELEWKYSNCRIEAILSHLVNLSSCVPCSPVAVAAAAAAFAVEHLSHRLRKQLTRNMRQMSSISLQGQVRTTGRDWGESWNRVVGETLNSQLYEPQTLKSVLGPSERKRKRIHLVSEGFGQKSDSLNVMFAFPDC